jgi:23S rRNA U2552 (ribose-2'-O)-methylase RlmE/FtsJ
LGFIRGTALNTVGKELEPILRAKGIDTDKLKGNDNLYRGLLIKGLQIKLEKMKQKEKEIVRSLENELNQKDEQWISENAQAYLDRIISDVNRDIEETLSKNEYAIVKLENEEAVAAAIEGLKDLNVLLQDKFRLREVPKEIKISTLAVRNILAAA